MAGEDTTVLNPNGTPIPLAMPQAQAPTQPPINAAQPPQAPPSLDGLGTSAPVTQRPKTFSQRFFDAFNSGVQANTTYSVDPQSGQITKNAGNPNDWSKNVLAAGLQALGTEGDAEADAQQQIANTKFNPGTNGRAFGASAYAGALQRHQMLQQQQKQQADQNAQKQAQEQSQNVRESQELKLKQAADARAQADNLMNAVKGYNTNLGDGYVPMKVGGAEVPEYAKAEDAFKFMNQNGDQLHQDYKWRLGFDPATQKYQVMERSPNFDDRQDRTVNFVDGSSENIHGATQDEANAYMKQRNAVIQRKEPLFALENDPNQAFGKENYAVSMAYLNKCLGEATDDAAKDRIQKLIDMGTGVAAERIKETHEAELSNLTVPKAQSIVSAPAGTYTAAQIKQAHDYLEADITHKDSIKSAGGAELTGPALDQTAQRYWETGTLPPMGYGAAAQQDRVKIMNRAAELHNGDNIAANASVYKANTASLGNLQKQYDAVNAFETTANANLTQMLRLADTVVDTKSPWVNEPLRTVDKGLLGGADQARFDAARAVALTEIARVLNSPQGTGVVSDSARAEALGLIGRDATYKQIVEAAKVLKQDMDNRKVSYQQQIGDIQKRLNDAKPTQQGAPSAGAGGGFWQQFNGVPR